MTFASVVPMSSDWSLKNPYASKIVENYVLNGEGSNKETRHIAFDLGDSGLTYKVGDALGVVPENPPHIVDELIALQGWDPEHIVTTQASGRTLREALKKDVEIHMATSTFVADLLNRVKASGLRMSLQMTERTRNGPAPAVLANGRGKQDDRSRIEAINATPETVSDYLWTRDYVDILREFNVRYTPEEFLSLAGKVKPRLYSISSSPDAHPGLVELTVGIVRFEYHGRQRGGLCTQYLADEIGTSGTPVGVFMSPTKSFVLPDNGDVDIIMVGPGTGIAPFRAFMEQRVFDKAKGRNWLFFGDQSEKTEYYYKEQIEDWLDSGDLYKFTTAWSRDQEEKIYVQQRLKEHGAEVWAWFEKGAYFYICGDKSRMAKDVHRALIEIAMEHGGLSEADATHFVEHTMMKDEKRYLRDVY